MQVKTDQIFIVVDATFVTKNKLEESILKELQPLNDVLCSNLNQAKTFIQKAIDTGTENCPTAKRCKPVRTEYYSYSKKVINFRANDFIRISLHPVHIKD